jgi:hypothetical protein
VAAVDVWETLLQSRAHVDSAGQCEGEERLVIEMRRQAREKVIIESSESRARGWKWRVGGYLTRIGCRIIPGRIQTRRDIAGQWQFGYTAVRIADHRGERCGLRFLPWELGGLRFNFRARPIRVYIYVCVLDRWFVSLEPPFGIPCCIDALAGEYIP